MKNYFDLMSLLSFSPDGISRADTLQAGTSSMVFKKGAGERSITTRDLNVNDMSVIQFDVRT